jgi:enoyl-[acyl-carrier-protein] reductase (NADH)
MLKRSVFPEDIAEAVYFLAADLSAKSTGNIINVDAGNAQRIPTGRLAPAIPTRSAPAARR